MFASLTLLLGLPGTVDPAGITLVVPPTPDVPFIRPAALPADALAGYYACSGEINGKAYSGVVQIQQKGSAYVVQWAIGGGSVLGVGQLVRGENGQPDLLCVAWIDGQVRGSTVYRVRGRAIEGTWIALPGDGSIRRERLQWLSAAPEPADGE